MELTILFLLSSIDNKHTESDVPGVASVKSPVEIVGGTVGPSNNYN